MPDDHPTDTQTHAESRRELRAPPSLLQSFRFKLCLLVAFVILLVATAVGAAGYMVARDNVRTQIGERLEDVVASRASLFRAHLGHLSREAALIKSRTRLQTLLIEHHESDGEEPLSTEAVRILGDAQASVDVIEELAIASPEGVLIGSVDHPDQLGTDLSRNEAFLAGREGKYLSLPEPSPDGRFRSSLVTAIRSRETDELIGVLLARVDMTPTYRAVSRPFRGWDTGEILLAAQRGDEPQFVFRPSLEKGAQTAEVTDCPALRRALRGESGRFDMQDYRDRSVLAAYSPVAFEDTDIVQGHWAVTAKIDTTEAYAPVETMRTITMWVAALLGLFVLVLAYAFAKRFTAPISILTRATAAKSKDQSALRAVAERRDEIGALARSFNQMRADLVAEKEALESRVSERTADLEAANRRLTSEVAEREKMAVDLREAKEEAEASNKAKGTFLAAMSHEIRTPMNGILGMAELLATTPLAPIQREYLGMVRESADSLLQVINDILDFSRIEAGRLELDNRPFELRDLVENTVRTFADRAHAKGLELTSRTSPGVPKHVVGDPLRLRQVLVNLLGNAIKFTERGEVSVEVRAEEMGEGECELTFFVRDTGIGIPKDKLKTIFQPFEQSDRSASRSYGGTGLGLTIAERVIEAMNGDIQVRSTSGKGSTFRFVIPAQIADQPVEPWLRPEALEGMRALVVDDNETNCRILKEVLAQWGMNATCITRSTEALDTLVDAYRRNASFHIVLLDAAMPELDGFDLADQILRDRRISSQPILMLGSTDRPEEVKRCKEIGVKNYLLKPIKQSELRAAIQEAFGVLPASDDAPEEVQPMPPMNVLIAEDNRVSQRLTVDLLEGWGHTTTLATDGYEAVDAYRARASEAPFDIVLMDVQMPEMDGFEATRAIRAIEKELGNDRVPIIAMTAHAMRGDRERCLEAGMDGYLPKPVRSKELRFVLERYRNGNHAPGNGSSGTRPTTAEPRPAPRPRGKPEHSEPEAPEAVDFEEALRHVDGRHDILRRMAESFLEDYREWMSEIDTAVSNRDAATLRRSAHTLKGAAQVLGAGPVAELARELEQAATHADIARATALNEPLQQGMEELSSVLSSYLENDPGAQSERLASPEDRSHAP